MSEISDSDYAEVAHTMHELYVALLLEGFNEAQAQHIVGKAMEGAMQK